MWRALLYKSAELGTRSVALGGKSVDLGAKSVVIGKKMLDKQDVMIGKQDEHIKITTEFRDQTLQGFVTPDTKYGRTSDNMDQIIDEVRNERKETRESMAKLTDAIIELARSGEQKLRFSRRSSLGCFFSSFWSTSTPEHSPQERLCKITDKS